MSFQIQGYSGQTFHIFSKLKELKFDKRKSHNPLLMIGLRALKIILKYVEEPEEDVTEVVFRLGILLKRFKFFILAHTDQQLLKEV